MQCVSQSFPTYSSSPEASLFPAELHSTGHLPRSQTKESLAAHCSKHIAPETYSGNTFLPVAVFSFCVIEDWIQPTYSVVP